MRSAGCMSPACGRDNLAFFPPPAFERGNSRQAAYNLAEWERTMMVYFGPRVVGPECGPLDYLECPEALGLAFFAILSHLFATPALSASLPGRSRRRKRMLWCDIVPCAH